MSSPEELVSGTETLVSLPEVYFKVKALVDDPEAGAADLADVIAHDPGLTARFLRIANSAVFGFTGRVETVSRAVAVMGMQQVHDLVLATSVARAFSGLPTKLLDMAKFWRDSVYLAILCRLLAVRCNVLDSERLFVEGLLSDVGHLVMYLKVPGPVRQALTYARQEHRPLHEMERKHVGCDYAQVGGALMKHWGLPQSLELAIRYQTEPSAAGDHVLEASILHIAVHNAADSKTEETTVTPKVEEVAWQVTGLSKQEFDTVCSEAYDQLAAVMDMFFPGVASQSARQG